MKKIFNIFWNPEKKTSEGFKYATYFLLAPILLLSFVLPVSIILAIYLIFFILRTIVSIRAAAIHEIDKEKLEKYSGKKAFAKRAYAIFSVLLACYISLTIFFYVKTDGLLGLILTLLIALITLPGVIEEIVIIRRCQSDYAH